MNTNLTDEQQSVINLACEGHNVLVDACIGSGKTTTINELCKQYIRVYPNKKIVYLTYNKLLKLDAQKKIGYHPNIFVTNYHGYAYKYVSAYAKNNVSNLLINFVKEKPYTPPIDLLVIDEYQDIDGEIADMLKLIKKNNRNMQMIVVGDMHQKIYDKTSLDIREFITGFLGDHIQKTFTYCFRLNESYAKRIGDIWEKQIIGVNNDCSIHIMSIKDTCEFLNDKQAKDILVLGKQTNGIASNILNKLEMQNPNKFNKNTVYVKDRYNNITVDAQTINSLAIFTTYDGSKGLEKDTCVITDFTEKYIDERINMGTKPDILKNLFCVAMSRGKHDIIFVKPTKEELQMEMVNVDDKILKLAEDNMLLGLKQMFTLPASILVNDLMQYKSNENVNKCFNMMTVTQVETTDNTVIPHNSKDGYIDLSKHNTPFIQANFFENYDIDNTIFNICTKRKISIPDWIKPNNIDDKARLLAYVKTGQMRYYTQIKSLNFSKDDVDMINKRLQTTFCGDEDFLPIQDEKLNSIVDSSYLKKLLPKNISRGRHEELEKHLDKMRVIFEPCLLADDAYYLLCFNSDNSTNNDSITSDLRDTMVQALFTGIILRVDTVRVWNIQTNQMYEVSTEDVDAFLMNVVCTQLNLPLMY